MPVRSLAISPIRRHLALVLAIVLSMLATLPLVAHPVRGASTGIVISEFRTRGPAGASDEFVELHNRSASPIDVGGLLIRGSNASGFVGTRVTLAAGTTIGPGCFLLVTGGSYSGSVVGEATFSTGITDDGGIGLVTAGGDRLDEVGMSTGSEFKEGTPLAPFGSTNSDRSYERRPGGLVGHEDTDDNVADFTMIAPSRPQNAASDCLPVTGSANPSGSGTADPSSVDPGDDTLLSVAVTGGTNPPSTGLTVTADLSSIGGSPAQALADGDGDGTYTHTATVATATAPGSKSLPVSIGDGQGRTGATTIALTVLAPPTEIWEIQGTSHLSPIDGEDVFGVEGIVTHVRSNGFWMTDPTPDTGPGSEATSDGIFVFSGSTPKPAVGAHVTVDGEVDEFRPGNDTRNLTITQLRSFVTPTVVDAGPLALPTTVIGIDRLPPGAVIDDDSTTTVEASDAVYDPAGDGIDFWESLEGMRLSVADAVAVGRTNAFGEVAVVSGTSGAGLRTPRGGILVQPLGPAGDYRPGDFNPERLIIDDVLAPTPAVNVGDGFANDPVGLLDYSFGNFKLLVTVNPGRVDNGLAPEITVDDTIQELSVATFNVENLSPKDDDAKVARLAEQIVTNLQAPDIIAIEEIQDNSGDVDDTPNGDDGTVAADASWQRLIDAIVAAGGPRYEYRQIDPEDGADGGIPGGNIRVGFLFQPSGNLAFVDRPGGTATTPVGVAPVGHLGEDPADVHGSGRAQLTISPGRILPDPDGPWTTAFDDTRKPVAGEFRFRGASVFVVATHLSSKGDDRPLFGRFQPPFRLTEFESTDGNGAEDGWRHAQAQVINDFVDELLAIEPDANVVVLGDINDFDFSETVDILAGERVALDPGPFMPDPDGSGQTAPTGAPPVLTTLFDLLPVGERYSYVFDGNSQVLDQILVSRSLLARAPAYDVVHVNAEFFDQASDHDPSVMRVRLRGG